MFKYIVVVAFFVCAAIAAPQPKPLVVSAAYAAAPVAVAPAVVTAQSSQVIARNYNTLAAPIVAAPAVAPVAAYSAPFVAAPAPVFSAYSSPYVQPAYYL